MNKFSLDVGSGDSVLCGIESPSERGKWRVFCG